MDGTDGSPELVWQLYVEALRRGLRIPPGQDFLAAASEMTLALNTATTAVEPVPLPVALAEVYRLGNTMPAWKPFYQPTAAGRVCDEYRAFVWAIAVPPDGGGPRFRSVREAKRLLRELDEQLAAGSGSLVMPVQTDSGETVAPRYDTAPLGKPGYSEWLDLAILSITHGIPPAIDVTVAAEEEAPRRNGAPPPAPPPSLPAILAPFAVFAAGEIVVLRLTVQSATYLPLQPGGWFVASLLRDYSRPQDFLPGTPFATGPIWGPDGIFNLLSTGLHAGFRPRVEVTVAPAAFAREAARALERAAGAATLAIDLERSTLAAESAWLQGVLLGMMVDAPNSPVGPGSMDEGGTAASAGGSPRRRTAMP
jgi:hypothetical protein